MLEAKYKKHHLFSGLYAAGVSAWFMKRPDPVTIQDEVDILVGRMDLENPP